MIGQTLGHYRILEKIGEGGMGVVYRAYDERLERDVALKVLPPGALADEAAQKRFRKEALALSKLNHPNIETVHDFDTQEGVSFLVMEYIPGATLDEKIAGGPRAEREILRLGTQLAEALAAAHDHGIAHRDLKPGNLRVTPDDRLKILDFGLAKLLRPAGEALATKTVSDTRVVAGTLPYMAPEQLSGEPVDARTDIYAAGVVLYEMATGQRPFRGDPAPKLIDAIFHQAPPAPRSLNPKLTPELERIIFKCLEKEPENRYQSAKELVVDLRRLARDTESARSAAIPRPRAVSGKPASFYAVLMTVGAVLIATGLYLRISGQGRRVRAAIASLDPAVAAGRLDEVFERLQASGVDLSDPRADSLAKRVAGSISITSEPSGATVTVTRLQPIATLPSRKPLSIGRTPVSAYRLVAGEYLVRLQAGGKVPAELLAQVGLGKDLRIGRTLLASGAARDGMVLVEEGAPPFLIDRLEVSNEQFQKFVAAGGYREISLWPETMIRDGRPAPRASVLEGFVDRTGVPGPRNWSGGVFPQGRSQHPVTGVSWYEAAAYARWAGKELPAADQWWRAAVGSSGVVFPWGNDVKTTDLRANFGLAGTRSVGSYPAGISPYGCYDMAGNVREWLRDTPPNSVRYYVAGGSWEDPPYMFERSHAESFDPAFASEAVGFRLVMGTK